jgi:hypothetical protein
LDIYPSVVVFLHGTPTIFILFYHTMTRFTIVCSLLFWGSLVAAAGDYCAVALKDALPLGEVKDLGGSK